MANLFSLSLLTEYSAKNRACIFRVKAFLNIYGLKSTKSAEDAVGVKMGNLKDYDFDLKKLWKNKTSSDTRKWIKDTKCSCHWECIYSYNIISDKKQLTKSVSKSLKYF